MRQAVVSVSCQPQLSAFSTACHPERSRDSLANRGEVEGSLCRRAVSVFSASKIIAATIQIGSFDLSLFALREASCAQDDTETRLKLMAESCASFHNSPIPLRSSRRTLPRCQSGSPETIRRFVRDKVFRSARICDALQQWDEDRHQQDPSPGPLRPHCSEQHRCCEHEKAVISKSPNFTSSDPAIRPSSAPSR